MASSFTAKLESFTKAVNHLISANNQPNIPEEFWIPTMITYFKISFELAWKTMKRHMQDRSIDAAVTGSPRDILKLAYREGYLTDERLWLNMLDDKNTMEHQYDEVSKSILERIGTDYLPQFKRLLTYLNTLNTVYFE